MTPQTSELRGDPSLFAFTLTRYEGQQLLDELDRLLGVANRDTSVAKALFEKIATQLWGQPVTVGETYWERRRRELRDEEAAKVARCSRRAAQSWWRRLWGD